MQIASMSDIHLEFGVPIPRAAQINADILILSGDITTLPRIDRLKTLLAGWEKPVLYVLGNHEYYHGSLPMAAIRDQFRDYCAAELPQLQILDNQSITIDGVQFFGGTMWTDFGAGNAIAMITAHQKLNDFRHIHSRNQRRLTPEETRAFHQQFKLALQLWLETPLSGPRVVITHHSPAHHPQTIYRTSPIQTAFVSEDMLPILMEQPIDAWFYGHTHEHDQRMIGSTHVISNQRGYLQGIGYECPQFSEQGLVLSL